MKSAIAVLTYNRVNVLKEMLSGISQHCPQYPIAIFDDLSNRDGTETFLRSGMALSKDRPDLLAEELTGKAAFPRHFLGTRNLGVTGNSNRALKWFLDETDAEHFILCNDDLHVLGDFVQFYGQAHANLQVGMFCFCDFTHHPSYRWVDIKSRGYNIKLCPRMTGIMISVHRKVVEQTGYFDAAFGKFGEEHCTTGETPIWMGDYTFKPIIDVRVGDKVIGWRRRTQPVERPDAQHIAEWNTRELCSSVVEHADSFMAPVVRVLFESGAAVTCTEDHLWALYKDRGSYNGHFYEYASPSVGRTLTRVVTPQTWAIDDDYRKGYIKGALDGDGSYRTNEVVLRVQNIDFTSRFRACLSGLGIQFNVGYYEKDSLHITRIPGGNKTFETWSQWEPSTQSAWRGWLGGMYDAEGSGRTIGQSQRVNPDICAKIYTALNLFGFDHYTQDHQICIKGGREELLRFWNTATPVCSYKMDGNMLTGRFKKPDKIIAIVHAGSAMVYGLKTSTGNYIAGGYASKNCDWTNRARLKGAITLNGMMQTQIDLHHYLTGQPEKVLLKHQEVETSMKGVERNQADQASVGAMRVAGESYRYRDVYRPFCLHLPKFAGATHEAGIPTEQILTTYDLVTDFTPRPLAV